MNRWRPGAKLINSILPVLLAFLIGGIMILLIGENPLKTYQLMLGKSLFTAKGLGTTLHYASPMVLAAIAIAITFKAGIFNMGVDGQLIFGGFFAGLVGAYLPGMSSLPHKLLCFAVGAACGMLFALVPALLRAYLRVDEMVVTLTLNYAMLKVLEYLSSGPFREAGAGYVCTPTVRDSAMFTRLGNSRMTAFSIVALLVFMLMAFVMRKTVLGYSIDALGKNPVFAEAVGLRTRRKVIVLMLVSGALAGLAGAGHMLSEEFKYTLSFSGNPGIGWDGMLIALLGRHSPMGILVSGIFYSALKTGADNINMYTSVPKEIVSVVQGLIILFLAIRFMDERYSVAEHVKDRLRRRASAKEGG